jgi:hypothetical protein
MGRGPTRSNLAKANERRDYRIFRDFAFNLVDILSSADHLGAGKDVYALDSTTVDLCLNLFWWATFRRRKAGVKLHTLLNVETMIPVFIQITPASVHDVNIMDSLVYQPNAWYLVDRAYLDYARLHRIVRCEANFVIRAKSNLAFKRIRSRPKKGTNGILSDQIGRLSGRKSGEDYPEKIRRISYHDSELDRKFIFLTNNMEVEAIEIAELYRQRWKVELFFKWIKQHLKIKSFWGQTENAVKVQLYVAISTYCMVAMVKEKHKAELSVYEILQILGISALDKTPVAQLLKYKHYNDDNYSNCKQLKISFI